MLGTEAVELVAFFDRVLAAGLDGALDGFPPGRDLRFLAATWRECRHS